MKQLSKLRENVKYKGISINKRLLEERTIDDKGNNTKERSNEDPFFNWKLRGNPENKFFLKKFKKNTYYLNLRAVHRGTV